MVGVVQELKQQCYLQLGKSIRICLVYLVYEAKSFRPAMA